MEPTATPNERIPRWTLWLIWILMPAAVGVFSVYLGATFTWDARMYHYYNGFAFVEDRMGHDIAPAARQSFHNPLPDLPFYLAYRHLYGPPAGFLLGLLHGLNVPLLFLVVWYALGPTQAVRHRLALALAVAAIGVFHRSFLIQVGDAAVDNLISLFVLGAFVVLFRGLTADRTDSTVTAVRAGVVGFVLGAAFGIKLTAAIFCLGAGLAIPLLPARSWVDRASRLAALTGGGVVGFASTGGFWALKLWHLTENPFFPYLNQIFGSPLVAGHSFEYRDFLSKETLTWGSPAVINEELWALRTLAADDVRYPIIGLLLCLALVVRFFDRRPRPDAVIDRRAGLFLIVFFATAFVAWIKVFAIHRYLLPLGLISPVVALALLDHATPRRNVRLGALAVITILVLATADLSATRRVAWRPNPYTIDLDGVVIPDDALVVMIDLEPIAYMIPSFPRGVRFVRPGGNLFLQPWNRLHQIMSSVIRSNPGPIFTLHAERTFGKFNPDDVLNSVGLERLDEGCVCVRDRRAMPEIWLCPAVVLPTVTNQEQPEPGASPAPVVDAGGRTP